jgi:PAS domain S-box-containing protein
VARSPDGPEPGTELEEFFELSIDPLSIIGFDGAFKRVNASLVRLLGYAEPELFSRSALDILHPDDVAPARAALARLAAGDDIVRFEARVVCADGAVRWLEWSTRSMRDRGVVFSVGRDTTERRRVEAELRDAHRLLEASGDQLRVLAEEQAALRRVATLVGHGTGPESVFRAVADEVGALIGGDTAAIVRFDADGWATVMGAHQARRRPGDRFEPDPGYVVASARNTGHAARFDTDDPSAEGTPEAVRAEGIRSALAVPIVVDGDLWGTITVASLQRSLAVSTERRLAGFTELVATAISNTQAREELRQLANAQGALRRVATLVASEASQAEVFTAIADECAALFGVEETRMFRFEAGPSEVVVAASGTSADIFPVGSRYPLGGENATTRVFRTGRPAGRRLPGDGDRPDRRCRAINGHQIRRRGAHLGRGPALGRLDHGNV